MRHPNIIDGGTSVCLLKSRMSRRIRVLLAMSGGIDSSVSALLLKQQGYDVHGVLMKNWDHNEEGSYCSFEKDNRDVDWMCRKLGIDYSIVNFTKQYWNKVFQPYLSDVNRGLNPNPDVLCNKHIKFNLLLKQLPNFEADLLATGHYALTDGNRLKRGKDKTKDQSYFIALTDPLVYSRVLFPVGNMLKNEVQLLAREAGLFPILARKESMGLCFVGKRRTFHRFLSQYIPYNPGKAVSVDGKLMGEHIGQQFYTIGQRARISGKPNALFVVVKDPVNNVIRVSDNTMDLYSSEFIIERPEWHLELSYPLLCSVQVKYRGHPYFCIVKERNASSLRVEIVGDSIRAVAPGQFAVFYLQDLCLGGARILSNDLDLTSDIRDLIILP